MFPPGLVFGLVWKASAMPSVTGRFPQATTAVLPLFQRENMRQRPVFLAATDGRQRKKNTGFPSTIFSGFEILVKDVRMAPFVGGENSSKIQPGTAISVLPICRQGLSLMAEKPWVSSTTFFSFQLFLVKGLAMVPLLLPSKIPPKFNQVLYD